VTLACVFGCEGLSLSPEEAAFFHDARPWGFILFGRNISDPEQVRALIEALRLAVDRVDAPVMIDQEGGRVQRLRPPHWRRYPPARAYAASPGSREDRMAFARLGGRLIANDLSALGINVDCAPVVDVPSPGSHDVIGDRAFASSPETVALLARAMAEGLLDGGVLPVIKHMPGHGRGLVDSHLELPIVNASLAELKSWDMAPFRHLSDMPIGMSAHVVYTAIDPREPCTTSALAVSALIREGIGFDGLLLSDDISMGALKGDLRYRTTAALSAGCDVVLHCNGDPLEMRAVASAARELAGRSAERAKAALASLAPPAPMDETEATAAFEAIWTAAS
jgi:beta-N-acetylhexosaminidase